MRYSLSFFYIVLAGLLHATPSFAGQPLQQFGFDQLTVKDGLSHGIVNSICQDKQGFLWIGTFDGLDRFDGDHFKVYKSNRRNPQSLAHNVVHDVCVDHHDDVWCVTERGVSCYHQKQDYFENYILLDDSTKQRIIIADGSILCDRQGTIWVSTNAGLSEYIPSKNDFRHYRHYANDSTTLSFTGVRKHSLAEDIHRQGLWLGTPYGVNYFDTKTKIAYHYKNNPQHLVVFNDHAIFGLCVTSDNRVAFADNSASLLCFYDITKDTLITSKKVLQENRNNMSLEPATFYCDSKNNFYIGTWAYLFYYMDGKTGEVTELIHDDSDPRSINSTFCWDVYEDKEGTLWFGGVSGISYFNPNKNFYQVYRPDLKYAMLKKQPLIFYLFQDKEDKLWIGAHSAGLISYDFNTGEYENYSYEINSGKKEDVRNTVFSIEQIGDEFWLGTTSGVKIFDLRKKTFRNFNGMPKENLEKDYAYHVTSEGDSVIWILTNQLYRYSFKTGTYKSWTSIGVDSTEVQVRWLYFISKDSKGLWLGSGRKGLIHYESANGTFRLYPEDISDTTKLPATAIYPPQEDEHGNVWMPVRSQGFSRLNPVSGNVQTWNSSDGLVFDPCMAMAEDKFGRFWIAGYNLISVFDTATKKFDNFSVRYAETNYNYSNKMVALRDGRIASCMLGAIIVFDPAKQHLKTMPPRVLISKFSIFGKEVPFSMSDSMLSLSYKQNFFSFDYAVFTGIEKDKIQYAYKLEGFDKEWVEAGNRHSAAYTNVPGGEYVFKVRARNGDHAWTESSTNVNIHISKIYYQTWWFRFLVALFMFLLIRIYVRFRNSQRKQEEAEQAVAYFANSEYTNSSPDEILWDLARNCISRLGFTDCVIYMVDAERNMLVQKAALGDKTGDERTILNPLDIPLGKGIVGSAAQTGRTELINDTSKDSRYITDDASRLSEIAVPIVFDGRVIGVIDSEHPKKNFFREEHRRILETIASICATKIVNAVSSQELAEKEKKLLEIDKRVAEMRLMALRAQMNPHFIFNCLNAIDNYILKSDVQNASRYLNKFARLIRAILADSDKNYISLKSELEFLKNYMELENLRFDDKFNFEVTTGEGINADETDIPPMLIQPYVENAIVHGLIHKQGDKKLMVKIEYHERHLLCIIEDNGIGRAEAQRIKNTKAQTHESKGMRVTEGRLELLQQQVKEKGTVTVIDLQDEHGKASGTRVEILIPVEE